MKINIVHKYSLVLLLITTALLFTLSFSCKKEEVQAPEYTNLTVVPKIMRVGDSSGAVGIKIYASGVWRAKIADSTIKWLTIDNKMNGSENIITAHFESNAGNLPRIAKIAVSLNDETDTVRFKQEGDAFVSMVKDSIIVKSNSVDEAIPIQTNVPAELLKYSIKLLDGERWIQNEKIENGQLKFTIIKNEINKRVAKIFVSFKDAIGDILKDSVVVVQKSVVESAELQTFSYVKTMLVPGKVDDNYYIKGIVISDKDNPNMARNPNSDKTHINKSINYRTAYIQSMDGKYGLKLVTSSENDNVFERNTIVKLWLKDLTVVKHSNPDFVVLENVQETNVISVKDNPASLESREVYIKDLTDQDLFTYVTLKQMEISIPDGSFSNINEGYSGRSDTYAMNVRDINGNDMYMLINYDVPYRRNGEHVPMGSGEIKGILVHENLPRYGNIGKYQIRPMERSDIDLAMDQDDGFSRILVKWSRFKKEYDDNAITDALNPLIPDVGSGILSKSQADPNYTLNGIYSTVDYNGLTTAGKGVVDDGAFGAQNWWDDSKDQGNYWLIKTSSLGINKPLSIQFDGNNNVGGPKFWALEWSSTGLAGSWNKVTDFTFPDVTSWGNTLYTQLPGFKSYSFQLPIGASNLPTLYIRLRVTSKQSESSGEINYKDINHLGYISVKYNK